MKARFSIFSPLPFFSREIRLAIFCAAAVSSSSIAEISLANPNTPPAVPPPIPARNIPVRAISPIDYFRELLAKKPEEREIALAGKSPRQKEEILAKIHEYEAMPPEERALRLKLTEVRWYLVPLMKMSPVERLTALAKIPEDNREFVERRLKIWDELPPQLQREFLKKEATIGHVLRMEQSSPDQQQKILETFSKERREQLEKNLAEWHEIAAEDRQKMCERFNQFFELDEAEKQKTLGTFSVAERQQMEKTLATFEKMPPDQRRRCIISFRKFAGMTAEERNQFLQSAERWQAMSPSEREAWRDIIQKSRMTPPMPPVLPPVPRKVMVSTNAP